MTLPPTSYAPVDSRMIGGFGGLRSSSAKAVLLRPANNNAANGCNCFQPFEWLLPQRMICLLQKYCFAVHRCITVAICPIHDHFLPWAHAVFALVLPGGVLRGRLD